MGSIYNLYENSDLFIGDFFKAVFKSPPPEGKRVSLHLWLAKLWVDELVALDEGDA